MGIKLIQTKTAQVVSCKWVHNQTTFYLKGKKKSNCAFFFLYCFLPVCRRQQRKQEVSQRQQANRQEQEVSRGKMVEACVVFMVTLCSPSLTASVS